MHKTPTPYQQRVLRYVVDHAGGDGATCHQVMTEFRCVQHSATGALHALCRTGYVRWLTGHGQQAVFTGTDAGYAYAAQVPLDRA